MSRISRYLSSYLFRRIRRTATRSSRIERRHRVVTARRSTEEGSSSRSHVAWRSSRTAPAPSYVRATLRWRCLGNDHGDEADDDGAARSGAAPCDGDGGGDGDGEEGGDDEQVPTASTVIFLRRSRALCRELGKRRALETPWEFSVYVFERGKSSEAVMERDETRRARGVRIKCAVDGSAVSKFAAVGARGAQR